MPIEDVIETMRNQDIRIPVVAPGAPVEISFTYRDPQKAYDTVQALVARFQAVNLVHQSAPAYVKRQRSYDQIDRMEARIAVLEQRLGIPPAPREPLDEPVPVSGGINLTVIDPPIVPDKAVYPDRYKFMFAGFGIGFAVALVIAILRRRVQPAIPFPAATA